MWKTEPPTGPVSEPMSPAGDFVGRAAERARQMLEAGSPRREILAGLATAGELLAGPGATVSILVLDEHGLLRNGASPNLPADYLDAIDRLKPDIRVGTCAAAAATGLVVITRDFAADDKWAELRHLPHSLGFVGAWSMPIKSPDGRVLGTFGTYYRDHRSPTADERTGVERLAATAALVLAGS
jgi:GAF domain-containing protein